MEELKEQIEKLPESERAKLLLELYPQSKSYSEVYAENPGKKQKTLDSWLIKRNDSSHGNKNVSPSHNKELKSISTSAINNMPKNCSNSNKVVLNNMKDTDSLHNKIPNGNDFSRNTENTINLSEKNTDNSSNNLLIKSSKKTNLPEKYNLRSKRKFIDLSSINQSYDYATRYKKENKTVSSSSDSDKKLNFCKKAVGRENEKLESSELIQSHTHQTSINQHSPLSNDNAQSQNDSRNVEHVEDEHQNTFDVSSHTKTSYKPQTKRKKAFVKSGVDCSSGIIVHKNEKLNSNSELITTENNLQTTSLTTEMSDNQYCSLSNNSAQKILNQCVSSNIQHMEQIEYENFNNSNVSSHNKTSYKLRNKTKKAFVESGVECCSGIVAYEGLNNQLDVLLQSSEQNTTVSQQSNYEAFCKLNTECSKFGINVMDILGDESIQNLLNDSEKLTNESVVCIGSFNSTLKKTLPVVHLIESKKKLLKCISELQKIL